MSAVAPAVSSDSKTAAAGVTATPAAGASASASADAALPATHQRVHLAALGAPWQVVTEPTPRATQPGSAVVRVIATEMPPNAAAMYGGKLPYKPPAPMTPGGSCYGVVVAVADDVVGGPAVGTHVLCNRLFKQNEAALLVGAFSLTPPHVPAGAKQTALWRHGAWAQYAVLPHAALVAVPDSVRARVPPHVILRTVTLAIAHGALITRGRFEAGQTVLVGGATGIHGLATVLLALAFGADAVYVMGRSAAKLKALTALSPRVVAVVTGDGNDEKALTAAVSAAFAANNNARADVYVDFYPYLPSDVLTRAGISALKVGGTAVLGGGVQAHVSLPYSTFLLQQLTVTGSLMYPDATLSTVLKLLGAGAIDTSRYGAAEYVGLQLDGLKAAADAASATKDDPFRSHVIYPNGKPSA